jgi:hypothetical protein
MKLTKLRIDEKRHYQIAMRKQLDVADRDFPPRHARRCRAMLYYSFGSL